MRKSNYSVEFENGAFIVVIGGHDFIFSDGKSAADFSAAMNAGAAPVFAFHECESAMIDAAFSAARDTIESAAADAGIHIDIDDVLTAGALDVAVYAVGRAVNDVLRAMHDLQIAQNIARQYGAKEDC